MVRMPVVPDNYFDSDQVATGGASNAPDEPVSPEQNVEQSPRGILDGLPEPRPASGLNFLLDPQDIATVPGLSAHVYESAGVKTLRDYADQRLQQDFGGLGDPSGAVVAPTLASASAQSKPAGNGQPALDAGANAAPAQDQPNQENRSPAEKATDATLFGTDAFNAGRQHVLESRSSQYAQDMAKRASGFAGDVRTVPFNYAKLALGATKVAGGVLGALDFADDAYKLSQGQISKGKFALDTAVTLAPFVGGPAVEAGALLYNGVDKLYPGGWPGLAQDNGRAYQKYVIDNPLYDPRLAAMP